MTKFTDLNAFIDSAVKSRKYPTNTAFGLKAALKVFEGELNEEEAKSIDKVRSNINQISQSVYQKQQSNLSASSLAVYKSRVLKVINDYEKYGTDPSKMANWSVKVISRERKKKTSADQPDNYSSTGDSSLQRLIAMPEGNGYNQVNVSLNGRKFICVVPADMTEAEFKKL